MKTAVVYESCYKYISPTPRIYSLNVPIEEERVGLNPLVRATIDHLWIPIHQDRLRI